jgi:hypothetical protein
MKTDSRSNIRLGSRELELYHLKFQPVSFEDGRYQDIVADKLNEQAIGMHKTRLD